MARRTPLLIHFLAEARKPTGGSREAIGKLTPRQQRHLQRAAVALRQAGAFGLAGIPGARKQVRVGGEGLRRSGAAGYYIPIDVLQKLASGGSRRSIPFGKLHHGHRGMSASSAVRYRYGRSGMY